MRHCVLAKFLYPLFVITEKNVMDIITVRTSDILKLISRLIACRIGNFNRANINDHHWTRSRDSSIHFPVLHLPEIHPHNILQSPASFKRFFIKRLSNKCSMYSSSSTTTTTPQPHYEPHHKLLHFTLVAITEFLLT